LQTLKIPGAHPRRSGIETHGDSAPLRRSRKPNGASENVCAVVVLSARMVDTITARWSPPAFERTKLAQQLRIVHDLDGTRVDYRQ
jgi:hypothetical protein